MQVAGFYGFGNDVIEHDYFKQKVWLKKACELKHPYACVKMGYLYLNATGVKLSYSMAMEYFAKACDLKEQSGCSAHARLFKEGHRERSELLKLKDSIFQSFN